MFHTIQLTLSLPPLTLRLSQWLLLSEIVKSILDERDCKIEKEVHCCEIDKLHLLISLHEAVKWPSQVHLNLYC